MAGNDEFTALLIHSDTTDGSTTFTDDGAGANCPHAITANGDVHHESNQHYFGTTSIFFDGTGDYLTLDDHADFDFSTSDFTIDFWMKKAANNTAYYLCGQYENSSNQSPNLQIAANNKVMFSAKGSDGSSHIVYSGYTSTSWCHVAAVRDGNTLRIFLNGVQGDTADVTGISFINPELPYTIGALGSIAVNRFCGYIDEFRLSKGIARWTSNFIPPSTPYTVVGAPQDVDITDFSGMNDSLDVYAYNTSNILSFKRRIPLTLDSSKIDAALTDFPVLVHLGATSGITTANVSCVFDELASDANRKKIAITTADGTTQCHVEIERWDHVNKEAWLWVKVPSISSDSDTTLYLYYDVNQTDNIAYVGDTGDAIAQLVWDEHFVGVWHLAQDPSGGDGCILDSTANANHGTPGGGFYPMDSNDFVDAKVGKGLKFYDSYNSEWIDCGTDASLNNLTAKTVECVCLWDSDGLTVNRGIISKGRPASSVSQGWYFYFDSSDYHPRYGHGWGNEDTRGYWDSDVYPATLIYYHLAVVYDASTYTNIPIFYQDGVATQVLTWQTPEEGYSSGDDSAYPLLIGNLSDYSTSHNGKMDEVRISNVVRSAAWMKATYNSNWDSLVTFGAEEELPDETRTVSSTAFLSENLDAIRLSDTVSDNLSLSESIDAIRLSDSTTDGAVFSETLLRSTDYYFQVADNLFLGDSVEGLLLVGDCSDGMAAGDGVSVDIIPPSGVLDSFSINDTENCDATFNHLPVSESLGVTDGVNADLAIRSRHQQSSMGPEVEITNAALSAELTLPALACSGKTNLQTTLDEDLPSPAMVATALVETMCDADLTLPSAILSATRGAHASVEFPLATISGSATACPVGSLGDSLPKLSISASATPQTVANANLTAPSLTILASTIRGASTDASLALLPITLDSQAHHGLICGLSKSLPVPTITSQLAFQPTGDADMEFPAFACDALLRSTTRFLGYELRYARP